MLNTLVCLLVALALQASPRTWTDSQGRTIRAEFVRVYQGNVVLLSGNGMLKVPLGKLSWQDQEYVRQPLEPKGQTRPSPDRGSLASARRLPKTAPALSPPIVKASVSTVPEPRQRSSGPMSESQDSPDLAGSRHTDSDSSAGRWSNPGMHVSPPARVYRRGGGTRKLPGASPPQRPMFERLTVEEANSLIVDRLFQYTGSRDVPRRKSTSPVDWPDAKKLVRVEQDNVPILGAPDLAAPSLSVFGVASVGEILALVEQRSLVALMNPLGNAPDQSGLWYKVRMLDGKQGWIIAEPQGHSGCPIARAFAAQGAEAPAPGDVQNAGPPMPNSNKPQAREPMPSLGAALTKPLNDPRLSPTQRVGRGIGMIIGGGLAVLVLLVVFGILLLVAGGWRWWRWRGIRPETRQGA